MLVYFNQVCYIETFFVYYTDSFSMCIYYIVCVLFSAGTYLLHWHFICLLCWIFFCILYWNFLYPLSWNFFCCTRNFYLLRRKYPCVIVELFTVELSLCRTLSVYYPGTLPVLNICVKSIKNDPNNLFEELHDGNSFTVLQNCPMRLDRLNYIPEFHPWSFLMKNFQFICLRRNRPRRNPVTSHL